MPYNPDDPELEPTPDLGAYELTLTGISPGVLRRQAERRCQLRFGECPFRVDTESCRVCMQTLGGRPLLYEAHFVAQTLEGLAGRTGETDARG